MTSRRSSEVHTFVPIPPRDVCELITTSAYAMWKIEGPLKTMTDWPASERELRAALKQTRIVMQLTDAGIDRHLEAWPFIEHQPGDPVARLKSRAGTSEPFLGDSRHASKWKSWKAISDVERRTWLKQVLQPAWNNIEGLLNRLNKMAEDLTAPARSYGRNRQPLR